MKKKLRKKYAIVRRNIHNRSTKNEIIYDKVLNSRVIKNASIILIYVSTNYEVDTLKLIKYFLEVGKKVAVPKVLGDYMNFYFISSLKDLAKGYMNIYEPITDALVVSFKECVSITPGIAYSLDGYRIGYGKGFYDKFYRKNKIYSIGLCYKECLIADKFCDEFDEPVSEIITD